MSRTDDPMDSDRTRIVPRSESGLDNSTSSASNFLPNGTRLGEFEITGLIGEGGFGIVYSAYDHLLEREVAIKEYMPSALAARTQGTQVAIKSARHEETFQAGLRSFVNEAKLLAQFDHPSLVKVYRFWESNGTAYMVMPLYRGVTLREALKNLGGQPSEAWILQLLGPLCEALETIHAANCFHRDIAPDNIMILPNGAPLLLDFGAARRVIGDITQALTVILKPGYAPLEQYANGPEMRQGPWTDVYALAAVVYCCMTGRAPVPSVSRMMKDTLAPAREVGQGTYSDGFLAAVDRGLAVSIDERTASVAQFREEIGAGPGSAPGHDPAQRFEPTGQANGPSSRNDPDVTRILPGKVPTTAAAARTTSAVPPADPLAGARDAGMAHAANPAAARAEVADGAGRAVSAASSSAGRTGRTGLIAGGAALVAVLGLAGWLMLSSGPTPTAPPESAAIPAAPPSPAAAAVPAPGATAASQTPSAPATAPAPGPTPPVASLPQTPPVASSARTPPAAPAPSFSTDTMLEQAAALRDPNWSVQVTTESDAVRIGQGKLRFKVRSSRAGYLYLLMVGTDRSHFYLLFPNSLDGNNRIGAQTDMHLPRPNWTMEAGGPPGVNRFIALVTPSPRDFTGAGLQAGQPFSEFDLAATQRAFSADGPGALAGRATGCRESPDVCSTFGAATFAIREFQ